MTRITMEGMESCSRTQRRELTMVTVKELFGHLAVHILRKKAALERIGKDVERHKELVKLLEGAPDMAQ